MFGRIHRQVCPCLEGLTGKYDQHIGKLDRRTVDEAPYRAHSRAACDAHKENNKGLMQGIWSVFCANAWQWDEPECKSWVSWLVSSKPVLETASPQKKTNILYPLFFLAAFPLSVLNFDHVYMD